MVEVNNDLLVSDLNELKANRTEVEQKVANELTQFDVSAEAKERIRNILISEFAKDIDIKIAILNKYIIEVQE